ncbi:MAG TPA: acyltransferase [Flavisolibacter sp.]|nr:acyltransferase [Flavisolibacter sp.]
MDGLRGIAILMVLLLHHFTYTSLRHIFYFGFAGVDLFFVLSGFLISGILLDTKHMKGYLKIFFVRRALRIMPLYFGVLVAFAFAAPHVNTFSWFNDYQIYFWTYTNNFLILQEGFKLPLGHFWSLALEEQFYLVWPFFILLFKPRYLVICSVMLILFGLYLRLTIHRPLLTYGLPLAHLDGLLLGALAAIALRKRREWIYTNSRMMLSITGALLAAFIIVCLIRIPGSKRVLNACMYTVVSLFFAALLLHSLHSEKMKRILSHQWLLFLGKYSYGIYVFNSIIIHVSNWVWGSQLTSIETIILNVTLIIPVLLISYLSYHLFEKHFLKLKPNYSIPDAESRKITHNSDMYLQPIKSKLNT